VNSKLSEILEYEYQHRSFAKYFPFAKLVGNTHFHGGFEAKIANKYRIALNVAFQLLPVDGQKKLLFDEKWEEGERTAMFEKVNDTYLILRSWAKECPPSTKMSNKAKPNWQGVANYVGSFGGNKKDPMQIRIHENLAEYFFSPQMCKGMTKDRFLFERTSKLLSLLVAYSKEGTMTNEMTGG